MATLYQMKQEVEQLYALLESGEIEEEVYNDTVEAIGVGDKIEGYCQVISQLKQEAEMFAAEEKRCKERKQALTNSVERMKTSLRDFLLATGQEKAKAGTFNVRVTTSRAVNITDSTALPEKFLVRQEPKIDKTAIGKALKDGETVSGAELIENKGVAIR